MVKKIIDSIYPMSNILIERLEDLLEYLTIEKKSHFIKKGKINRKEYFLLDGVCKSYLINPDGDEITISFFTSNSILSPFTTRTSNNISLLNFKALTELKIATIDAFKFEKLIVDNIEIRNFANTVLRNELAFKVDKEIGLASLTAKERLLQFREKYSMLENLIPHTDIASYLGITNISLSRIRKELMK